LVGRKRVGARAKERREALGLVVINLALQIKLAVCRVGLRAGCR
jgi:hypothetical protein